MYSKHTPTLSTVAESDDLLDNWLAHTWVKVLQLLESANTVALNASGMVVSKLPASFREFSQNGMPPDPFRRTCFTLEGSPNFA